MTNVIVHSYPLKSNTIESDPHDNVIASCFGLNEIATPLNAEVDSSYKEKSCFARTPGSVKLDFSSEMQTSKLDKTHTS
jgi:hypothetical protein